MTTALAPARPADGAEAPIWLFVDTADQFGGHEVMLLRWLDELRAQGRVRPRLLAREGSRLLAEGQAHASTALPARRGRAAADALRVGRALWAQLRADRPALVVFASGTLANQVHLGAVARAAGAAVVFYVPLVDRFSAMGYTAGWLKDAFVRHIHARIPQGWVVITADQARHFQAWARPTGRLFLLPNTVHASIEAAPRIELTDLVPGQRLRVLVLGRMDAHQKGLDMLLAHLQTLSGHALAGIELRFVGDGAFRQPLQAALDDSPALAAAVRLMPWSAPLEALQGAQLLFLPSRFEGVPLVMLEAMALGLPVVASDLPGTRPYLPPDCLFPVGDMAAAWHILGALGPAEPRRALGEQAVAQYRRLASNSSFSAAVAALTQQLAVALAGTPQEPVQPGTPHAT